MYIDEVVRDESSVLLTDQDEPLAVAIVDATECPVYSVKEWIKAEYELIRGSQQARTEPFDGQRDFVLRLGRDFPSCPLPEGIRNGLPRRCFHNAASLALRHPQEFLYAEGYAFNEGICTEHAWCVDKEGCAVDPTWKGKGSKYYFGIGFLHSYVQQQFLNRGELGGLINVWDGPERCPLIIGTHSLTEAVADLEGWLSHGIGAERLGGDEI